jgi:hypothetical protein
VEDVRGDGFGGKVNYGLSERVGSVYFIAKN